MVNLFFWFYLFREDEIQVPMPASGLDAKRRGLSRSALQSHQPVARPISAGLSRYLLEGDGGGGTLFIVTMEEMDNFYFKVMEIIMKSFV